MRILALFGMAITLLIRKKFPVAITMSIYVMYLILNIIPLLYPPINAGNLVLSMMLMLAFACAVALVMLSNFGVSPVRFLWFIPAVIMLITWTMSLLGNAANYYYLVKQWIDYIIELSQNGFQNITWIMLMNPIMIITYGFTIPSIKLFVLLFVGIWSSVSVKKTNA